MIDIGGNTMFRRLILLFVVALIAAACASGTTEDAADGDNAAAATAMDDHTEEATDDHTEEATDDHTEEATDDHADDHTEEATDVHAEVHDDDIEADRVIAVSMTELAFTPNDVGVAAGETIKFVVANEGQILHEFRLSNPHRVEEHIAAGHADHGSEGGHHEDADVLLELDPGETGELTVTFTEDTTLFTEIVCLIPGHYEAGMKGTIRYT